MAELLVLLQALLLVAGWLLFLRAQTELRAQAARQSLTGEMEELRRTIEMLLQRLASEAEEAELRVKGCIARLQPLLEEAYTLLSPERHATERPPITPDKPTDEKRSPAPPQPEETSTPPIGYNSIESEAQPFGMIAVLARQGLSLQEIARQTGYAPGEVELILNLQRRHTEEEQ